MGKKYQIKSFYFTKEPDNKNACIVHKLNSSKITSMKTFSLIDSKQP